MVDGRWLMADGLFGSWLMVHGGWLLEALVQNILHQIDFMGLFLFGGICPGLHST